MLSYIAVKVIAQRTQELTDAKRSALHLQELASSLQQQLSASSRIRDHRDARAPLLPVPGDAESTADSVISEGESTCMQHDIACRHFLHDMRLSWKLIYTWSGSTRSPSSSLAYARAPELPRHGLSTGVESELDVGVDENIFELRVVSAKLSADFFSGLPTTFVSFDFFQHDTQVNKTLILLSCHVK